MMYQVRLIRAVRTSALVWRARMCGLGSFRDSGSVCCATSASAVQLLQTAAATRSEPHDHFFPSYAAVGLGHFLVVRSMGKADGMPVERTRRER
jgi:hypothetical protein